MNITKIPTIFVKEITCQMENGEVITINEIEEVLSDGDPYTCVIDFIESLEFSSKIMNIKVKINHPSIEKFVDDVVVGILANVEKRNDGN